MKLDAMQAALNNVDKQNKPKPKKQVKQNKPKPKKQAKAEVSKVKKDAAVKSNSNKEILLKLRKEKHQENRDKKTKLFSFSLTTKSRRKLRTISDRLGMSPSQFVEYVCENNEEFTFPVNNRSKANKKLVSLTLSHKSHKWLKKASGQCKYKSLSAFLDDFLTRELPETKEIPPKR